MDEPENQIVAIPVENTDGSPAKPLLKDAKTGKFIKGTGGSGKGGRPPGVKDKVSTQMVELAQQIVEERGYEMFLHLSEHDPAACLALVTKLLPASELSKVFDQGEQQTRAIQNIQITLTPAKPKQERLEAPEMPRVASTTDVAQPEAIPTPKPSANRSENPAPARARGIPGGYRRGGTDRAWDEVSREDSDYLRDLYTDDGIV